jgi:hypothetical protein
MLRGVGVGVADAIDEAGLVGGDGRSDEHVPVTGHRKWFLVSG